jgi:hypothetical protein
MNGKFKDKRSEKEVFHMSKSVSQITVGKWILNKVNTKDWRAGKLDGCKHYNREGKNDDILEMMKAVGGRNNFMNQVNELKNQGLITVTTMNMREIREITISMEQIDRLCEYEHIKNDRKAVINHRQKLMSQMENTDCKWLLKYENDLMDKLDKGTIDNNLNDENIFKLLNAITTLKDITWKRKFSADVLGESKLFEDDYQNRIVTILKNYSPLVTDEMKDLQRPDETGIIDTILAEHGILTYSQTLQLKGGIIYNVGAGDIDTSKCKYGTIINAQSISHAKLISLKNVKHIITIENQANYENMVCDEQTLYIFTHGFLSPKERMFLKQIEQMAGDEVTFEHWSDLDYGGIRIYLFMKNKVFPRVKPLNMDISNYENLYKATKGCAIPDKKRKLLEKIDAEELTDLKDCILNYGVEFEQETQI